MSVDESGGAWGPRALIFPVCVVGVTALCLGYDAGVMSGAIDPIQRRFDLNPWEVGVVMGCLNVVAAPSALVGSWAGDVRGRVIGTSWTALALILGPIIVAFSWSFSMLVFGRMVTGVGVGFAFVIAPLYASELAPPELRGRIVTITEVLINLGVVLGYASAMLLDLEKMPDAYGWRVVTGLAAVPAVLVLFSCPLLPESPRWLAKQQNWTEAEKVMTQMCDSDVEVQKHLEALKKALSTEEEIRDAPWSELFLPTPTVRRMLLAGLGCAFFQQASGSEAIVYYSPTLLEAFGLASDSHQNRATIAVGLAKLGGAVLGGPFLDAAGRRPGVVTSTTGCAVCLALLASMLGASWLAGLGLLCLFMVFFELGLAPAAFVLGTECYPVAIRAKGLSLGMFTTRLLSGIVSAAFPAMVASTSLATTLWTFSFVACIGVAWALSCVPETKNLPLEEVAQLFERAGGKAESESYGATKD